MIYYESVKTLVATSKDYTPKDAHITFCCQASIHFKTTYKIGTIYEYLLTKCNSTLYLGGLRSVG